MSINRDVDSLDGPLIDKDLDTDEWVYPDDIERTVRGRIPDDTEELVDRLWDELRRRLLDAGLSRSTLALFFGRSRRATCYVRKRAGAIRVQFDDGDYPSALMNEDEFDRVVDEMGQLFEELGSK